MRGHPRWPKPATWPHRRDVSVRYEAAFKVRVSVWRVKSVCVMSVCVHGCVCVCVCQVQNLQCAAETLTLNWMYVVWAH